MYRCSSRLACRRRPPKQLRQLGDVGGNAPGFVARGSGASRTTGPTPLPNLLTASLAQQKIFQDKFAVTSSKRRTANPACYFPVTGGLWSGFGFDDLIKGIAVRALEKSDRLRSSHDQSPLAYMLPALSR